MAKPTPGERALEQFDSLRLCRKVFEGH
jgi:hypothetical protein